MVTASRSPSVEEATFLTNNRKHTNNHNLFNLFFGHCKKTKHTKENCFELNGYPKWWGNGKKSTKPKAANSSQSMEAVAGSNACTNQWSDRRAICSTYIHA